MPSALQLTNFRPVFQDPNAFATTLMTMFLDMYLDHEHEGKKMVCLEWAPETIRRELHDDLGFAVPALLFDRLMMGLHLLKTDSFYKSPPDFIESCLVLSGAAFTPQVFSPADSDDCAWGITEALLLSPPDEADPEPFSAEVCGYIGEVTRMEGIINPPDVLRIATRGDNHLGRVQADLADDPELSAAVWSVEASKTQDINDLVKGRLSLLVDQLESLRLVHGDTAGIVPQARKLLANLAAMPSGGSPL